MKLVNRSDWTDERIRGLLAGVPFFNEVLRADAEQFQLLLDHAEVLVAQPGDVVMRQGDDDSYLYFLLRGQLGVMAEQGEAGSQVLNYISPGEVFGTLAMLRGTPRTATIRVDDATREAVLARIDFTLFSNVRAASVFSLETRLSFYKMLVHNIRWTLEVNRMQEPDHAVVSLLRKVPLYAGPKGTQEELDALHQQAHVLADLLCQWNESPPASGNMQLT